MPALVEVAVAVLVRADGAVLLARRPAGKVYAGYWEFPGGKVEPGEAVSAALAREIREELGIEIGPAFPWLTRVFDYPHARVRLHFHRIFSWRGEPGALEHDALAWQHPESVTLDPLLPANGPVLRGLQLPAEYAITHAGGLGNGLFFARLETRLRAGLKLIQIREKGFAGVALEAFAREVVVRAHFHGAKVLVNADAILAQKVAADGVHITAAQLRGGRPDLPWCGASCHSSEELRLAESLGADFVVLGSVQATPTHPGAEPLGWKRFGELVEGTRVPIYALGGITPKDLEQAMRCGAHGIAMVRGAWAEEPDSGRLQTKS